MHNVKPLPSYLLQRYNGWKATGYADNQAWYRRLANEGQRPRAMMISCCDSRVHVTSIFGADQGEFFIHRNIANLVPPYEPDGDHHGTSAAVEYGDRSESGASDRDGPFELRWRSGVPRHVSGQSPPVGRKNQLCRPLDGHSAPQI